IERLPGQHLVIICVQAVAAMDGLKGLCVLWADVRQGHDRAIRRSIVAARMGMRHAKTRRALALPRLAAADDANLEHSYVVSPVSSAAIWLARSSRVFTSNTASANRRNCSEDKERIRVSRSCGNSP